MSFWYSAHAALIKHQSHVCQVVKSITLDIYPSISLIIYIFIYLFPDQASEKMHLAKNISLARQPHKYKGDRPKANRSTLQRINVHVIGPRKNENN